MMVGRIRFRTRVRGNVGLDLGLLWQSPVQGAQVGGVVEEYQSAECGLW